MKPVKPQKLALWLRGSLGIIGGLSLLGIGLGDLTALATTQSLVIDATPSVSSSEPSPPPVEAAPKAPISNPVLRKDPVKPIYKVSPKSSVSPTARTQLAAPKIAVPKPKMRISRPQVTTPSPEVNIQGKNSYIDSNNYGVGQPVAPPSVILTERQSGCQTVAEKGQLTRGNCGVSLKKPVSLAKAKPEVRNRQVTSSSMLRVKPQRSLRQALVSNPQSSQTRVRHSQGQLSPRRVNAQSVISLQPIERRGLSISLEPVAPYNRATSLYTQQLAPVVQKTTDLLYPLPIIGELTSAFGWRQHPIAKTQRFHNGTDLAAPLGTPVLAAYQGVVESADWAGGYGLMVVLNHLEGTQQSRYAHLSEIFVQPNQTVEKGEIIGRVGSTGYSTGPHLHFEWLHNTENGWVAVDAGLHLEYALENLIRSMEYAQQLEKDQG